ncbi:MAG: ATP-binding cassette domain-containing protein [Pseudomonadales bacterium]
MMTAVVAQAMDVTLSNKVLLHDINFTIPTGSVCCILGESGSGKTTLLRAILGLIQPSAGAVEIDRTPVTEFDYLSNSGVVYQYGALMTSYSVFENVAYPLREYGGLTEPEIEKLVYDALTRADLKGIDGSLSPAQISGGMAKRVAIARALALDPNFLFLDEPTSGLDPISSGNIGQLINDFHAEGDRTVMMTTHDEGLVKNCCDHLLVVQDKTVVACGPISEVRSLNIPVVNRLAGVSHA